MAAIITRRNDLSPGLLLTGAITFSVCVIFASSWLEICSLTLLGFLVALWLKTRIGDIMRSIAKMWLFLLLTFLIHWIVNSQYTANNGNILVHYFNLSELSVPFRFTFRLLVFIGTFAFLNQHHEMQRYGSAVGRFLAKSPVLRSTFAQLELMATLAMRMVPILTGQFKRLEMALTARGETFTVSMMGQLRKYQRILYPVIIESMRRADHTALALQARGYDPSVTRTYYLVSKDSKAAVILLIAFCLLCVLALFIS